MSASPSEIKCTILTLRSENVMVPNAAIAEIISAKDAVHLDDAPPWYLGNMPWRSVDIPLVSYEAAAGSDAKKVNLNTQVAVLYSANKNPTYPYIGLVISGVPHVSVFDKSQIQSDSDYLNDENPHPMIAQKTRINGAAVSILDTAAIEDMIVKVKNEM